MHLLYLLSERGLPWWVRAEEPPLPVDAQWGRGVEVWESSHPSLIQRSWASINSMSMQWAMMTSWRQKSPWELKEGGGELQVRNSSTWLLLPCTQSCCAAGQCNSVVFYMLHRLNKGAKRRNETLLSFLSGLQIYARGTKPSMDTILPSQTHHRNKDHSNSKHLVFL